MLRPFMLGFVAAALTGASPAWARPESPKPGLPFYSDAYETRGDVSEIKGEKNLEEVYQNYEYFESRYDEKLRPVLFRAYKKGEVVLTEHYSYDASGKLEKKRVERKE